MDQKGSLQKYTLSSPLCQTDHMSPVHPLFSFGLLQPVLFHLLAPLRIQLCQNRIIFYPKVAHEYYSLLLRIQRLVITVLEYKIFLCSLSFNLLQK